MDRKSRCCSLLSRKVTRRRRKRRTERKLALFLQTLQPARLLLFFILSETCFFVQNPYVAAADSEYLRECDELTCKLGEQCVSRKFWCNTSPCPTMTYCSRSRKESLKGPEDCESVLCTSGFKCIVRVRECEWDQKCKQRAARCISEREYEDEPVSCVDFTCPRGHSCVLRESHCYRPPCKLTRSCARSADVDAWLEKCKKVGCHSEHECFLRRPPENCVVTCNHTPDCLPPYDFENDHASSTSDKYCRGWICPLNSDCSAHAPALCKPDNCRVARSCRSTSLLGQLFNDSTYFNETIEELSPRIALSDDENEFLEETRRLRMYTKPSLVSDIKIMMSAGSIINVMTTEVPLSYNNPEYSAATKAKRVTESIQNIWATSTAGDSPWLTYLKRQAGAEAVQYWIEKAKNNEDYEEFLEWLDSVALLLDPETYHQWLREVQQASSHVPEFQSWISPQNLAEAAARRASSIPLMPDLTSSLRSFINDNVDQDGRVQFPGAIDGRRKNIFYSDKSLVLVEPNSNSNVDYRQQQQQQQQQRQSFKEKQTAPSMVTGRPPSPSLFTAMSEPKQQHWLQTPSNFNFNEPQPRRQSDNDATSVLGFQRSVQSILNAAAKAAPMQKQLFGPYSQIANRQDSEQLPSARSQDFSDAVKNSWKSWQSYYQLNPVPTNLPGFSFNLNNHSYIPAAPTNIMFKNRATTPRFDIKHNGFGGAYRIDWPRSETKNDVQLKRVKLNDNQYETYNDDDESTANMPTNDVSSMINHLAGLQDFRKSSPNVLTLNPKRPVSQLVLPSLNDYGAGLPNLLIYFPPPLNFFIYYSSNSQNDNEESVNKHKGMQPEKPPPATGRPHKPTPERPNKPTPARTTPWKFVKPSPVPATSYPCSLRKSPPATRRPYKPIPRRPNKPTPARTTPWKFVVPSPVPIISDPCLPERTTQWKFVKPTPIPVKSHRPPHGRLHQQPEVEEICDDEDSRESKVFDRNKEREFIKRIIKELLDYWNREEKYLESIRDPGNRNPGIEVPDYEEDCDESSVKMKSFDENDSRPTYSTFLEWLTKKGFNSSLLNQKSRKKEPMSNVEFQSHVSIKENIDNRMYSKPETRKSFSPLATESQKKIRILVDIDKNPELMKALFSKNKTNYNNETDSREYQVIVNLDDFVDPEEEDIISRRLIDIAANQLHRNVSGEQKMPKTLWVFPIYEDENNITELTESENKNNEKVNTLEDVNVPTSQSEIESIQSSQKSNENYSKPVATSENDYEDYGEIEDTAREAEEDYDQPDSYDESEENNSA